MEFSKCTRNSGKDVVIKACIGNILVSTYRAESSFLGFEDT